MRSRIVLITFLVACSARAATYLVGTDRDLIRSSSAIVVATAGESVAIQSPRGLIETSTRMHVEEAISGWVHVGDDVDVVEAGGVVDHTGLAIAGSPRFAPGERLLLLLNQNLDGAWTTTTMGLGRFTFGRDVAGRELLVRDEGEIAGWDSDGTPHRERRRDAGAFLRFVRETASGGDPVPDYFVPRAPLAKSANAIETNGAAASTYLIQQGGIGIRWQSFPPVVFLVNGTQPGTTDGGIGAAQRSVACWTSAPGANIQYFLGGKTSSTNGLSVPDGTNSIVFNDPTNFIAGAFPGSGDSLNVLAVGGAWFDTSKTHTFNGETFYTINEADLVVQNGINTSFAAPGLTGLGFDHVVAHELGHTLGFRHSDNAPAGGTTTSAALMNSTVDFNNDTLGASLLAWDIEAADAVYPSGTPPPPPCNPPSITTQPQSAEFHNADVALTVIAAGTTPLSYQWYVGSKGDTRVPAPNGTNATLVVPSLSTTTSYWVRVTGQCSPPADSEAATITVNGCPAVAITSVTPDADIIQGKTQTLSVTASSGGHPLTYRWFAGARGDMSQPAGTGATIAITPSTTNTYWVLVANDCGANATSAAITVTVTPCDAPRVVIQPADAQAIKDDHATLAATISGSAPMHLQWYEGQRGDTTHPVTNANTSSFTTDALSAPASFWLAASNPCGDVQTNAASVTIVPTCTKPVINVQPQNQAVVAGTSAILTLDVSGPSLSYAWYQGPVFDFTHPVGVSAPSLATPPITAPAQFWVRISNRCGQVNSIAATVTPIAKRRSVRR